MLKTYWPRVQQPQKYNYIITIVTWNIVTWNIVIDLNQFSTLGKEW